MYDMYFEINQEKYIVEMDGAIGHGHEQASKKYHRRTPEESLRIDKLKEEIAEECGCKVIRIDAIVSDLDYLKVNIYKSELNNLFDLSIIDWQKVFEYTCTNLVKQVCDYKKNNL